MTVLVQKFGGLAGQRYAFGFDSWTPAPNLDTIQADARDFARQTGAALYTASHALSAQIGAAPSATGNARGAIAAAPAVMWAIHTREKISGFLAAFAVGQQFWCLAVLDDTILHDGDKLFTSEQDARTWLRARSLTLPFEVAVVPDRSWLPSEDAPVIVGTIHDFLPAPGPKVHSAAKVQHQLRSFSLNLPAPIFYGAAAAVTIAGVYFVLTDPPRRPSTAQSAQSIPGSFAQPSPADLIAECDTIRLSGVPIRPAGWHLTEVNCAAGHITATYSNPNSLPSAWLKSRIAEPLTVASDGRTATLNLSIAQSTPRGDHQLGTFAEGAAALQDSLRLLSLNLSIDQPAPNPGQTWQEARWRATLQLPASSVADRLASIPGIVVARVTSSYSDTVVQTTLEGSLYARP